MESTKDRQMEYNSVAAATRVSAILRAWRRKRSSFSARSSMRAARRFQRASRIREWSRDRRKGRPPQPISAHWRPQCTFHAGSAVPIALIPLVGIDEIQEIQAERPQHLVGFLQREEAFALQNVMDMRLGYPNQAGQATLGDCAAPHALPEFAEETLLKMFEIHKKFRMGYFRRK